MSLSAADFKLSIGLSAISNAAALVIIGMSPLVQARDGLIFFATDVCYGSK